MSELKSYAHLQCLLCRAIVRQPVDVDIDCPAVLYDTVDLANYSHNCSRHRPVTQGGAPRPSNANVNNRGVFRYVGFSAIPGTVIFPTDVIDHTVAEKAKNDLPT